MVEPNARKSLYRHALVGVGAIVFLFGGLIVWAAATDIDGAVVAPGTMVVDGGSKRVQHREGGIVRTIFVEDGDAVGAGDLLVQLDGTAVAANLAVATSQLSEAYAMEARLLAESTGENHVTLRSGLESWPDTARLKGLLGAQEKLLDARASTRQSVAARLEEQIAQIETQIDGLEAQKKASEAQYHLVQEESVGVERLYKEGLVEVSRRSAMQRELARLEGESGRLVSEIAAARTMIAEKRLQITQSDDEFRTEVLQDLQATGQKIAELQQQRIAAEDTLKRLEIRAPQAGIIHENVVRTIGGVIAPGEVLMQVVPQLDQLLVETRIATHDIDKLFLGQKAIVRLSSFDQRTTPELIAEVQTISADLSHDPRTGEGFYLAHVHIGTDELNRLGTGRKLIPGMPAEVFVETGERSVLSYLIHPFTEQIRHAFRED